MVGAVRVVTTKNVVHAALWLVLVLAGVGASFLLLGAEFVGITQVLVYIGAIVVLFLFGIMLTRAPDRHATRRVNNRSLVGRPRRRPAAARRAHVRAHRRVRRRASCPGRRCRRTAEVSDSIFSQYLIPFEVVGLLLTAALIGAIVLARKE